MSVLRSTTFQLEVKSENGKTSLRSFMRATSDADAMVKKLNAELGENATVTYKSTQSVKELTAQARMQITAFERTQKVYKSTSEQLEHNLTLVGKSASEQAALTAQFNLGSGATDKQRAAVGELAGQLSMLQQAEKKAAADAAALIAKEKALTAAHEKEATKTSELISRYTTMNKLLEEYKGDLQRVNATMALGSNATASQIAKMDQLVQANQKLRGVTKKTSGSFRGLRGQAQNLGWQMQDVAVQMQMGTDKMVIFSQQGSQLASGFGPWGAVAGAVIAVAGALAGVIYKSVTGEKSVKELADAQKILNSVFEEGETSADGLSSSYKKLFKRNKDLGILTAKQAQFAAQDNLKASRDKVKKLTKEYFSLSDAIDTSLEIDGVSSEDLERFNESRLRSVEKQAKALGVTVEQYEAINKEVKRGAIGEASKMIIDLGVNTEGANKALVDQAKAFATLADEEATYAQRADALKKIKSGDFDIDADTGSGDSDAVKAFEAEYARTIKQTETLGEEYKRRKKIVDDYLKTKNADHKKANEDIAALDEWLKEEQGKIDQEKYDKQVAAAKEVSDELIKEAKRRAAAIAGVTVKKTTDNPILAEMARHNEALKVLYAERKKLGLADHKMRSNINALIESETETHDANMVDGYLSQASAYAAGISSYIDMLSTGGDEIKAQTEEMNDAQKAAFLVSQAIAAAQAYVSGAKLGMELGAQMQWGAPAGIAFGNALGASQAGIIMGTTFAGMFDEGGTIPAGQKGIVSEYGDELVGGTMVYNNSSSGLNVTGREDTAAMMGGSPAMNVSVVNNAPGVQHKVEQVDANTVKLIASQVFAENIDSGVAGVISKRNSKASKAQTSAYKMSKRYS